MSSNMRSFFCLLIASNFYWFSGCMDADDSHMTVSKNNKKISVSPNFEIENHQKSQAHRENKWLAISRKTLIDQGVKKMYDMDLCLDHNNQEFSDYCESAKKHKIDYVCDIAKKLEKYDFQSVKAERKSRKRILEQGRPVLGGLYWILIDIVSEEVLFVISDR